MRNDKQIAEDHQRLNSLIVSFSQMRGGLGVVAFFFFFVAGGIFYHINYRFTAVEKTLHTIERHINPTIAATPKRKDHDSK